MALRFSWDFSGFHHCPWPSTFPALLSTRPNTVCGRREIKGVTSHTLGLQKEGEGVGVVCVYVGRRRKIAMKLHTCSFHIHMFTHVAQRHTYNNTHKHTCKHHPHSLHSTQLSAQAIRPHRNPQTHESPETAVSSSHTDNQYQSHSIIIQFAMSVF